MGFTAIAVGAAVGHSLGQMAQWLAAPVQALVGFFAPWQASSLRSAQRTHQEHRPSGHQARPLLAGVHGVDGHQAPTLTCTRARSTVQVSRLKVLRVAEPGRPRQCAGRMVISGRMDEVCAELDRLARLEDARGSAGLSVTAVAEQ